MIDRENDRSGEREKEKENKREREGKRESIIYSMKECKYYETKKKLKLFLIFVYKIFN